MTHTELPLSFGQERIWMLDQFSGTRWTYNAAIQLKFRHLPDIDALEAALRDLRERHEILRTAYPEVDGHARQLVLPVTDQPLRVRHLETETEAEQRLCDDARTCFDLRSEAPFRATIFTVGRGHTLQIVTHHIAIDGWSVGLLVRDLAAAYEARLEGRAPRWVELPVQYRDFAIWQHSAVGELDEPSDFAAEQLAYWQHTLHGVPTELALPHDRPRTDRPSYRGGAVRIDVPDEVRSGLESLAKTTGSTPFMVLHAGVAVLMYRLGAGTDIPIGTGAAGRIDEAISDLVGFFLNTLTLRSDLSANPTVLELIHSTRQGDIVAFDNQDVPFEWVVQAIRPLRRPGVHPIFQCMVTLEDFQPPRSDFGGAQLLAVEVGNHIEDASAKFDLFFDFKLRSAAEGIGADELTCEIKFSADLWCSESVQVLGNRLLMILSSFVADPGQRVSEIEVMDPSERDAMQRHDIRIHREHLAAAPPGVWGYLDSADPESIARWDLDGTIEQRSRVDTDPGLPEPDGAPRAPAELEAKVCHAFAEVLGVGSVTARDDFFALGGQSLTAAKLARRLSQEWGSDLDVHAIFRAATPARLAAELMASQVADRGHPIADPGREPIEEATPAQRQFWILHHLFERSVSENVGVAFHVRGHLSVDVLSQALGDTVNRHEALRTILVTSADGFPNQQVLPRSEDFAILALDADEGSIDRSLAAAMAHQFDLDDGPLVRAHVWRVHPDEQVLALVLHHSVCDGDSMSVLLRTLSDAYAARAAGRPCPDGGGGLQSRDWAGWAARLLDAQALEQVRQFWADALRGAPRELVLPTAEPRPTRPTTTNAFLDVAISEDLHRQLRQFGQEVGATLFMTLHGFFSLALASCGAGRDIVMGTSVSLRTHAAMADVVGPLLTTVPLRLELDDEESVVDLFARLRSVDSSAFANAHLPFDELVQAVDQRRSGGFSPLLQVFFALDEDDASALHLDGATVERIPLRRAEANFDLDLTLASRTGPDGDPAGLTGYFTYLPAMYGQETVLGLREALFAVIDVALDEPRMTVGDLLKGLG